MLALRLIALGGCCDGAQLPFVATQPATQVVGSTATLNGTVNPNGTDTTTWFEWGPTPAYGNGTMPSDAASGTARVSVSAAISGFTPGLAYHYRAVGVNAGGQVNGQDRVFEAPVVTLNGASILTNCQLPFVDPGITATGMPLAISAAQPGYQRLALKGDGTVASWGDAYSGTGQTTVPSDLTGVTAIAAGTGYGLALKTDGTVASWGSSGPYGQANIPPGLNNVVAISTSGDHSLALNSDGTVTAWGDNRYGQLYPPPTLNNVVAIAAGYVFSLALKSDGTVVAWGYELYGSVHPILNVPPGLSGVVAIAAGYSHSLALKGDGTVVSWGVDAEGETSVPAGLAGVVAIAAGYHSSLALRSDGTVVGWGDTTVPSGLNGVAAIATGFQFGLALRTDGTIVSWNHYGVPVSVPAMNHLTGNVTVSGAVNLAVPATYPVTYTVTNSVGGSASVTRTVAVLDATPPSLVCASDKTVETGPQNFQLLKSLGGSDGEWPYAGLIQGSDGALYGTTSQGGSSGNGTPHSGYGTVFRLNQDGRGYTVLKNFSGGNDGFAPSAGLLLGRDGALYGTTLGTVFSLNTDGSGFQVLKNFTGNDGNSPEANLIQGSDGVLYGTAAFGGPGGGGTVFKLSPNGTGFTVLHSFFVTAGDGRYPFGALLELSDGTLYGTTAYGGSSGNGTIYRLNEDGTGYVVLRSFATTDGAEPYGGLIQGRDGELYGTTFWGSWPGTIFKMNPDGSGFAVLKTLGYVGSVASLVQGDDGTLYGTTGGTIFKLNPGVGGDYEELRSFSGPDGGAPYGALILGSDGALYGTTQLGGRYSLGTIFKLKPSSLFDTPTATSHNGTAVASNILSTSTNGLCPQVITRTWAAADYCGNAPTCDQTVTLVDTTPPEIYPGADKTEECGTVWSFDTPFAYGPWGGTSPTLTVLDTVTNLPHITRTWQATDVCGNTSTSSQTVTLVDTTLPVITLVGDNPLFHRLEAPFVDPGATAVDSCAGDLTAALHASSTVNLNIAGTYSITYSVTDPSGNAAVVARSVMVSGVPPDVVTQPATGVSGPTASLNGEANPNGFTSTVWFEWGMTTAYGNLTAPTAVGNGMASVSVSTVVTGLTPGTYHFRALAKNGAGQVNGADMLLVVPGPVVTTQPATEVLGDVATLNGTVNPSGFTVSAWFEWGTTTAYGHSRFPTDPGNGAVAVPINALLTGLVPGAYHFRAVVQNGSSLLYGADLVLQVPAPTVTTEPATQVLGGTALLNGTVNPSGFTVSAWFEWGTTPAYGHSTSPTALGNGTLTVPISELLGGLVPGAYHFRSVVQSGAVSVHGADMAFQVLEGPVVETLPASAVMGTTATLNANVNPKAFASTAWFEWGIAPNANPSATPAMALGNGTIDLPISATLSSLTSGVLYRYRAVAMSGARRVNGSDKLFASPTVVLNGPNPLTVGCGATLVDPGANVGVVPVAISAGQIHGLALRSDGTVVAWGFDLEGDTIVPAGLNNVVAISAGGSLSLALKNDGTVVGWGDTAIPGGLSDVVAVAAGFEHGLALRSDGVVVAFGGINFYGHLDVPSGLADVKGIAAGYYFSLAVKADGTVVGWGNNDYGLVNIPAGLTGVVAVSAGRDHCLALKNDGTVVAWGDNSQGQTTVPSVGDAVAVAAGASYSLALRSDGTVVSWGAGGVNVDYDHIVAISAGNYASLSLRNDGSVVGWGNPNVSRVPANLSILSHSFTASGTVNLNSPGAYTLTYEATNIFGATAAVTRTLLVTNSTPPELTCASGKTVECGSAWDFDPPSALDGCAGTNVSLAILTTYTNGSCPTFITRVWQATDTLDNQSPPCGQTVMVVDSTPPVLSCASNKTVQGGFCSGLSAQSSYSLLHTFAVTGGDGQTPISSLMQASDGALYGTTLYGGSDGVGTVFKVNPDGAGYAVLHSFSSTGSDGRNPEGGLLQGSDGAIYGTTANGGSGAGTVFKIHPDGSGYTVLRRFSGSDGRAPEARLTQGSDGLLYGATVLGGSSFAGTIFRMDASGNNFTILKNFPGGNEANPEDCALVQGSDGTFYGTTGPRSGANGTVFKINPDGAGYAVLKTFNGSDGQEVDAGLLLASDGSLYGTTRFGGSQGLGVVFKLHTDGSGFAVLKHFSGADGSGPEAGLVEGCDGALYGSTPGGGVSGNGVVYKLNKDGSAFTVLRNFSAADNGGTGPSGALLSGSGAALYGVAAGGGSGGAGTAFKLTIPSAWSFDAPTAVDACCTNVEIAILSTITNSSNCTLFITRTWQATDCCGNRATCSQTLSGPDTREPAIIFYPTNVLLCVSNGCGIMPDATAQVVTTAGSGVASISQSIPAGQSLCANTPFTFTVTDVCGNTTVRAALGLVQPCCVSPPSGMVLWLTFDETAGATCFNSMGGNNGLRYEGLAIANNANGPLRVAGQYVNRCLSFDGRNDQVIVSNYPAINFGTSDFSADAWVKWSGTNGFAILAGKAFSAGANNSGFDWYLTDGRPGLRLITGSLLNYDSSATLTPSRWTHLAVTVQRANLFAGQINFYLDGLLTDSLSTAQVGSLSTPPNTALLAGPGFSGSLDELELFARALTADEVNNLYQAQTEGKCRPVCSVPSVASVCSNSVTVSASICNLGGTPLDFLIHFRGLSALESGLPNAIDWDPLPGLPPPSYFSFSPLFVHVLPGRCESVPVTIARPPALHDESLFGSRKTAAYEMAILQMSSGERFSCMGTLRDGWFDCPPVARNPGSWTNFVFATNLVVRGSATNTLFFTLTNPTNFPVTLNPHFIVLDERMAPETNLISLNGQLAGVPATNHVTLPPFGSADVGVTLNFTSLQPAKPFYLVLLADIGDGGDLVPIASLTLRNVNAPTVGPLLDLYSTNHELVVSWDLANSEFLLESAFDLSGTNWFQLSSPSVELPDARQGVTLPATNRFQLFRLRQ